MKSKKHQCLAYPRDIYRTGCLAQLLLRKRRYRLAPYRFSYKSDLRLRACLQLHVSIGCTEVLRNANLPHRTRYENNIVHETKAYKA